MGSMTGMLKIGVHGSSLGPGVVFRSRVNNLNITSTVEQIACSL